MVFRPHNLNIDTSSLNITLNDHKMQNVKFTTSWCNNINEHFKLDQGEAPWLDESC